MDANIKLFIADDENSVRNSICKMIPWEASGISVCGTAGNGQEAFDKIVEAGADVALLDIRMPLMTGLQVAEKLKAGDAATKIIILSGYDDFNYAKEAMVNGAINYLLKPCKPAQILDAVISAKEQILKERSREQEQYSRLDSAHSTDNRFVNAAILFIKKNYNRDITLSTAADEIFITAGYLSTLFKQATGDSFINYLNRVRIERACEFLRDVRLRTYEVAHLVGFQDEKYFTKVFKKITGQSPSQYRNER